MKRFTTKIMHKGEEKVIAVWLDDETARLLDEYGDEKLKHAYIVEEYKVQLIERSETRRHQSLEKSMEAGFDVIDESTDVEKEAIEKLWDAILYTSRVDEDPITAWEQHNKTLAERCAFLNSYKFI